MGYDRKFSGEVQYTKQFGMDKPFKHELYPTWRMMNVRCYDDRHKAYHRYGGRGITVCEEWRWDNPTAFVNFIEDVGTRPHGMTLDKINNDEGYSKINFRWATKKQQQNNLTLTPKRISGEVGIEVVCKTLQVTTYLCNYPAMIGIFRSDELEKAIERRDMVNAWKNEFTDEEILLKIKEIDQFTPTSKRLRVNKTSSYYGVSWDKSREKWRVMISYREKADSKLINKMVGRFDYEVEASEAALKFLEIIKKNGWYKKGITE